MTAPDWWFEDFVPGTVLEFGGHTVTEAEIIAFARDFDPQYFHTDPEAARASAFGGLIASGWHTAAIAMRMLADNFLPPNASMGSPGIDELRWRLPVRPGDKLRLRITIQEATRSRSKPDRGVVRSLLEVLNQKDEVVMSQRPMTMFRARTTGQG